MKPLVGGIDVNRMRWLLLLLFITTIAVYANSFVNGFVWDDNQIIVASKVNKSLANIGSVFTSADEVFSDDPTPYYRPVNRATYLVDHVLYKLNPTGYHVENVILHAGNVLLIFLLAVTLTQSPWAAFFMALLFSVHPITAEPVNFISARNNLLALFFFTSSLLLFMRGRDAGSRTLNLAAAGLFFVGLLCKETVVMLLPLLVYVDYAASGSVGDYMRNRLRALFPFGAVVLVYGLMRVAILHGQHIKENPYAATLGARLLQDYYILPTYFRKVFFPNDLTIFYAIPENFLHNPWLAVSWLLILGGMFYLYRTGDWTIRFGLAWFVINLFPISNIIPIPSAAFADRYLYLPLPGLVIAVVRFVQLRFSGRTVIAGSALLAALVLALVTVQQNMTWRNDITLYRHAVKVGNDPASAHYNLGNALKDVDLAAAEAEWLASLRADPRKAKTLNQLGTLSFLRRDLDGALEYYLRAVASDPASAEIRLNLAMLLERQGKSAEALPHYQAFLTNTPSEYAHLIPKITRRVMELQGMGAQPLLGQ